MKLIRTALSVLLVLALGLSLAACSTPAPVDVKIAALPDGESEAMLTIFVENVGFANFYEEAEVVLEFEEDSGNSSKWILDANIRSWDAGKVTEMTVKIPMRSGKIYLSMERKRDGRSVCLANQRDDRKRVLLGQIIYMSQKVGG